MSLSYTFKRLIRSWQLYIALLLGIVLASTFFAGINVGADTAARQALDQALSQTSVDMSVSTSSFPGKTASGVVSSKNVTDILQRINSVTEVANSEAQSSLFDFSLFVSRNLTRPSRIIGITKTSRVYDGWIGGAPNMTENQVYVWAGSKDASKFQVGEVLQINVTANSFDPNTSSVISFSFLWNLTVGGFVQLENDALGLLTGSYSNIGISYIGGAVIVSPQPPYTDQNILIADWKKTFASLLDIIYEFSPVYSNPVGTQILIYLNRGGLVYPWDIAGSLSRVKTVADRITEKLSIFSLQPTNYLGMILDNFQSTAINMRLLFITASVPVFFVAWYMGSTVSDVSVNLRRREIGLLLTKGFSKRQLLGIFLTEALLIGLIGGFIGIGLAFVLNPIFVRAAGGVFTGSPFAAWDTLFLTVAFAIIITFLSTFQSARRAQNIAAIDALRQYRYVEETKPYKRTWPLVAFGLGTFKMVILLLGINMFMEMQNAARGGMLISIFAGLAFILDSLLTAPIGPWLFAWGLTKLLIRGSVKFQELTSRAFKFLGDLGSLATKNVQRNPARSAAVAFLVTLIIAYSFQVTGTLASQEDFTVRNIFFEVGSDVSVGLSGGRLTGQTQTGFNVTSMVDEIEKNLTGSIASTTVEYLFSTGISNHFLQIKAVDPESWLATAYYENQWFSGRDAQTAIGMLKTSNESIVLERSYALLFDKNLDEYITLSVGQDTRELKIVGFFGNEPPLTQGPYIFGQGTVSVPSITYWSYVPYGLLKTLGADFGYNEGRLLIKLKDGAGGREVADKIRGLNLNIGTVDSVEERVDREKSDVISTGQLNVLRLGVIFAVLASSVGTALVTLVSLREREREASIMSVRGLSFKQLATMLLAENMAIIAFSAVLGTLVGLTIVRGTVVSSNASGYLVTRSMVFPPDVTLLLVFTFVLIFASTILPIILMSKRFSSRLERIVRQA